MVVLFLLLLSVCFLLYGGLVFSRKFTPPTSKLLVEAEELDAWCKTEGFMKILWGLDLAFLAMYFQGAFLPVLWMGCFLVLTVAIIVMTYKNNQTHMK